MQGWFPFGGPLPGRGSEGSERPETACFRGADSIHRPAPGNRVPPGGRRLAVTVGRRNGAPVDSTPMPSRRLRVAQPPERPLVLYDGECGFCKTWIARWRQRTGEAVDYEASQVAGARFPEIAPEAFSAGGRSSSSRTGASFSGAEAVARLLALGGGRGAFLWIYRRVPGAAPAAGARLPRSSPATAAPPPPRRVCSGAAPSLRPTYVAASALFLRAPRPLLPRGVRLSLWVQVDGLVGSARDPSDREPSSTGCGRRPARDGTGSCPRSAGSGSGDAGLHLLCGGGVAASLLLIAGIVPAAAAVFAWRPLPLAGRGGPGLPRVPVGPPAARGGLPRDLPRAAAALAHRQRPRRPRASRSFSCAGCSFA